MERTARRWQRGLSLLEVLIATLVLSIGLLGLAGLQVSSLKTAQNASLKQEATFVFYDLLERMRSNRHAALQGYYVKTTTCSQTPPNACSGSCTEAQQAAYDLYYVLCKTDSNRLPNGSLVVSCPIDADCKNRLSFRLTWSERLEQRGIQQIANDETSSTPAAEQEQEDLLLEMDVVI